jgi:hypothetical protein
MDTLGRPTEHDLQTDRRLDSIRALEQRGQVTRPQAEMEGEGP